MSHRKAIKVQNWLLLALLLVLFKHSAIASIGIIHAISAIIDQKSLGLGLGLS